MTNVHAIACDSFDLKYFLQQEALTEPELFFIHGNQFVKFVINSAIERSVFVPKASNLKKGTIIQINEHPYQVKNIEVQSPSARGANTFYKVRFAKIPSGQKLENTYRGNDFLEEMELERRSISFIYEQQDLYTFMDIENYEQYTLHSDSIEEQLKWLSDGLEGITALLIDGQVIAIEVPSSVVLEIAETAPTIKGATVTNRNKPATLSNGHTVQVPDYLSSGDVVQVNTQSGEYMSRVKSP